MPRGTQLQNSLTVAKTAPTDTNTHTYIHKLPLSQHLHIPVVLVQEHLGDTPGQVVLFDILRRNKSIVSVSVVNPTERSGSLLGRSLKCFGCCPLRGARVSSLVILQNLQQTHLAQQAGTGPQSCIWVTSDVTNDFLVCFLLG